MDRKLPGSQRRGLVVIVAVLLVVFGRVYHTARLVDLVFLGLGE